MKLLLGAVMACAILFFAVPIVAGGNTDICQDVPLSAVISAGAGDNGSDAGSMYNVINSTAVTSAAGTAEHDKEMKKHPHLPPVISCTAAFWASV